MVGRCLNSCYLQCQKQSKWLPHESSICCIVSSLVSLAKQWDLGYITPWTDISKEKQKEFVLQVNTNVVVFRFSFNFFDQVGRLTPLSQLKEFVCCSQFSWYHHQGIGVSLGARAPGAGSSSAKHRQITSSNFSFPFWLCDFYGKNGFNSFVNVPGLVWPQSFTSAFLKYAAVNLVCQDVVFVLSKCVYLWFTEGLKLLCTFPLSSLYLSSAPPVFLQSVFMSKEFGFFPLTSGNKQFRAKICFLR